MGDISSSAVKRTVLSKVMEHDPELATAEEDELNPSQPTHHVHDIRVGENGRQFWMSPATHMYDVENFGINASARTQSSNAFRRSSKKLIQTDGVTELEGAIQTARQALDVTPANHPSQADRLHTLSSMIARRHERTGNIADLEEAIYMARQALDIMPANYSKRPRKLYLHSVNLGNRLTCRYERTGLEEARKLLAFASSMPKWIAEFATPLSKLINAEHGEETNAVADHFGDLRGIKTKDDGNTAEAEDLSPCNVIQGSMATRIFEGIHSYAESHENDHWRQSASAAEAACKADSPFTRSEANEQVNRGCLLN